MRAPGGVLHLEVVDDPLQGVAGVDQVLNDEHVVIGGICAGGRAGICCGRMTDRR